MHPEDGGPVMGGRERQKELLKALRAKQARIAEYENDPFPNGPHRHVLRSELGELKAQLNTTSGSREHCGRKQSGPWMVTEYRWPSLTRYDLDDPDADEAYGQESFDDGRRYGSQAEALTAALKYSGLYPPGEHGWPYFAAVPAMESGVVTSRKAIQGLSWKSWKQAIACGAIVQMIIGIVMGNVVYAAVSEVIAMLCASWLFLGGLKNREASRKAVALLAKKR